MKRKIILTITAMMLVMALAACGGKADEKTTAVTTAATEVETTESAVQIENEKPVKIYYMNYATSEAELITTFNEEWSIYADLGVFGAFNSSDSIISFDSEKYAHLDLWDSVDTDVEYKIGYELSFDINGNNEIITILGPDDIENSPYLFMGDVDGGNVTGNLGVWLYDDVNQDGGFYSHILPEEVNDETLLTSIKLRPIEGSSEIENLVLTAFSYSSDLEFDEKGHYNGEYGYKVTFNK